MLNLNPKAILLISVSAAAIVGTLVFVPPLPQDPGYHRFSDSRTLLGVPNALNVLSNLAFVIVGLMGGIAAWRLFKRKAARLSAVQYLVFFGGVFLTGFGSAYYHLAPSNDSLFWDRLPMTAITVEFFCAVVSELIDSRVALVLAPPLLVTGAGSVVYWSYSESLGMGDLRMYILVQFLPVVLIILVLILYKSPKHYLSYVVALMIFYGLSRVVEFLDLTIFEILGMVSGHTLKHLLAVTGVYSIVRMLKR